MVVNLGECYFCNKPVMAGEGQSIKYLVRVSKNGTRDEYPTHKKCRKMLDK